MTCLGLTFESDEARQAHFLEKLREKLKDPKFRKIEGFPVGEDEDILRLSDPPYYTACPNPFLADFVKHWNQSRVQSPESKVNDHSLTRDPRPVTRDYHREPFAVDVSEGKTDPIYTAHSYHTKVPHKAIIRAILHYTEPGDIVLDGFAGSGMTGVAAQMCGRPDKEFKEEIEQEWKAAGVPQPQWGPRRVVLNDLGPAATFIAANYNLPFDVRAFEREARRILKELEQELGWMYETLHTDGKTKGRINYTVWSEVFSCSDCGGEVVFLEEALDPETQRVKDLFPCPHCGIELNKKSLERLYETVMDQALSRPVKLTKRRLVLINYSIGKAKYEKQPDKPDLTLLKKIENLSFPTGFPTDRMMHVPDTVECWGDKWRSGTASFTHVYHLFLPRAAQALGTLWAKATAVEDTRLRNMLLFWLDSHLMNLSIQNRYRPEVSFPYNPLTGVYYISSLVSEASPFIAYENKAKRVSRAFTDYYPASGNSITSTGDCGALTALPKESVDYVFTDPPFGDNLAYAELNFVAEAFHRVFTSAEPEAIVSEAQKKGLLEYQRLMQCCFEEYYRVLKPGRWMTVVFHNSRNSVWNAIQESLQVAGFVVADVRTLDKQQGSFNQAVAVGSVKQDLVISAYKPNSGLEERFKLDAGTEAGAWDFIKTHLRQLPVFVQAKDGRAETVAERMSYLLYDRMVAFHVQRGVTVPLSAAEFYAGLKQRFPERDGMYFLPEQVAEYDKKRMTVKELLQLELAPSDESSAIQWLRQQLTRKPQTFQELHPQFLKAIAGWERYEKLLELSDLLKENFFCYDGAGSIPAQLVSWLKQSSTLREIVSVECEVRGAEEENGALRTTHAALLSAAKDRWYIPDPNKAQDLEKFRERTLLKEFEEYRAFKGRQLKVFRLEAVRTGFKKAWQERDYRTIIEVAQKIPEDVLQEDPKLLMWYDQAMTRTGAG